MSRMVRALFCSLVLLFVASELPAPATNPNPTIVAVRLDLAGQQVGFLTRCEAFGSESEVIEIKRSLPNGQTEIIKTPGATKWLNLVCSRGLSNDTTFNAWRQQIENGQIAAARKDGAIVLIDQTGVEVTRFNFTNGWPTSLKIGPIDSSSGEPLTEKIEIAIERLQRQ